MPTNTFATSNVKILIVDDHPVMREALAHRISQQPGWTICGEAEDVMSALNLYARTKPDVVVTDVSLKKSDGIDLIKRIKAHDSLARILVWSMHGEEFFAERAVRAGAAGYITKEQSTAQIIDAIQCVLSGKVYLSPELREQLLSRITDVLKKPAQHPVELLTDRELEVFRLIGEGIKTHDIATRLHLSVKTVETHRDRIKKKLNLKDATELIRTAVLWLNESDIHVPSDAPTPG